jgi:hypothetical protein
MTSTVTEPVKRSTEDRQIAEKKRLALTYLTEAWDAAAAEGVDTEIPPTPPSSRPCRTDRHLWRGGRRGLATSLPARIRGYEFSVVRSMQ